MSDEDDCTIEYDSEGRIETKTWKNNKGNIHRLGNPAIIYFQYNDTVIVRYELWYVDGKLHRDDGPAHVQFANNKLVEERWFRHDCILCDENIPGKILYHDTGKILKIVWLSNNAQRFRLLKEQVLIDHENDLYECRWYNKEGNVTKEETICESLIKV